MHMRQSGPEQPDLAVAAYLGDIDISHIVGTDEVILSGSRVNRDRESWNVTGEIVSLTDLRGSQLFFWLDRTFGSAGLEDTVADALSDLRRERRLLRVTLRVANQDVRLGSDDWIRHTDDEGHPFWEVTLPSDPSEFREATR